MAAPVKAEMQWLCLQSVLVDAGARPHTQSVRPPPPAQLTGAQIATFSTKCQEPYELHSGEDDDSLSFLSSIR